MASVCAACGNHFPDPRPGVCVVCADERQWLPPGGQRWTTLAELAAAGHASDVREVEPGLTGIGTNPPVAIGQRSLLVATPGGNVLWDPSGFIDDAAVAAVRAAGGLSFVTASHPHFYGAIGEWAGAFGAEILVPADDAGWLRRAAVRGHDLRHAGRGPGDVRLVGAEPAAAVRGRRDRRLGRGAAVPLRPDLRRLVVAGAAYGRLGDRAAVRSAVHRAPARHGLGQADGPGGGGDVLAQFVDRRGQALARCRLDAPEH